MKTMLRPIALNEKSYNVTLLRKALEALGSPVDKREAAAGKAGPATLRTVRALLVKLKALVSRIGVQKSANREIQFYYPKNTPAGVFTSVPSYVIF